MNWKNMLAVIAAASTLVACGGESDSKAPDINLDVEVIQVIAPSDKITNTPLPIAESFDTAIDAPTFFNASYAALSSESDDDTNDNFYHSTAGVFLADGTPDPDPSVWITADADPHLRLGDGRFTIGQIVSAFAPETADPRKDTSPGDLQDNTKSWGELDLSSTFTVSFCVVDSSTGGLFQIFVDNNTSGSGNSIHGPQSRAESVPQSSFTAGQRASFDIDVGTPYSFIQLRSDSAGWVVIDDLVIENATNPAPAQPDCSNKTTLYGATQDGNLPQGTAFSGMPLDVDFGTDKDTFFGLNGTEGYLAISDDTTNPFYKIASSSSRIFINNEGNLYFANALWAAGAISGANTSANLAPLGDLDLSAAYSITIQVEQVPNFTGTNGFQVMVDNNTSGSANSIHGSASRLINILTPELEVGTLVINVPGDVTMNGTVIGSVDTHRGTENSLLGFRCPGDCGDPNGTPPSGIEISDIVVAYTGAVFVPAPPQAPTLSSGDAQIEVSWHPVGGATAYDVGYGNIDDPTDAGTQIIENIAETTTTLSGLTNGTEYFVFVRAKNANGNSDFSNAEPNPSATPAGAAPDAPTAPSLTAGAEQINVSWPAVGGAVAYDVAYNPTNTTDGATVVADVDGTSTTITGLTGDTQYYVFVRAKNVAGTSAYSPGNSATPTTAVAGSWTGANLSLFGTAGEDPSGTVDLNTASAVTITATGGDLGGSHFRAFYAYQSGISVPFTFTARIASVTETADGTFDSTNNARRYGIYIMESLDSAAAYTELGRFAGLELYATDATPTFQGSRSEKRDIGAGTNRGRGNTDIAIGDYLRIQVSQPDPMADEYLIQRFVSTDGVTYTENKSNNEWLNANGNALPTEVFVGFIAAPNKDTLTIAFDNISIVEN